eukprot:12424996-Karenia_brevis.AAC.1
MKSFKLVFAIFATDTDEGPGPPEADDVSVATRCFNFSTEVKALQSVTPPAISSKRAGEQCMVGTQLLELAVARCVFQDTICSGATGTRRHSKDMPDGTKAEVVGSRLRMPKPGADLCASGSHKI